MKRKRFVFFMLVCWFCMNMEVSSQEPEEVQKTLLEQLEFAEINETLRELFPNAKMEFTEVLQAVLSGELEFSADLFNQMIGEQVSYAFRVNKDTLGHMLILVFLSALFSNFSQMFYNKQIGEMGFYVIYMLMITLAVKAFGTSIAWAEDGIINLLSFMKALCPVYFLAVAIAKGSVSSAAFYNIALLFIFLIEFLIAKIMIPVIRIHTMIRFLDCLSEEEYLSKLSELIETGIGWILKTLLGLVVGMNVIQGLIAPAIDSVKRSAVTKGAQAIPGIGDALGQVTEIVLGTAVLVKNGIGAAGALICIAICFVPVMQIAALTLFYKLSAALIQPVSDKRMIRCLSNAGEGCCLLLKLVFTVAVLFLLTIAIVAATTGRV